MSDEDVWNLAAFLQELPKLDADRYKEMVAHSGGHHHDQGDAHDEDAAHAHDPGSEADHHDDASEEGHSKAAATDAATSVPSAEHAHETEAKKPTAAMHTHADGTQHPHKIQGPGK